MDCKLHPTAEAVATCAACGAGMCSQCDGIFYTENDKPICLECGLKEEEKNLEGWKRYQKDTLIKGVIASVVWGVGLCLPEKIVGYYSEGVCAVTFLIMLVAAIFFSGKALFTSEEKGFFEKLKEIFWCVVGGTLLLPFLVILCLIKNKWQMIKTKSKIKKIRAALGKAD